MKKTIFKLLTLVAIAMSATSCMKPYQEQKFIEVGANQTAYVIPLEQGNKGSQAKFKSVDYLEQNKVAAKRIYTPTQWHQTGRYESEGSWIPSVKVIIVDRTPVSREWTDGATGTNANKKEGIEVESKESIGFSVSMTATGFVPEETTSKFLYYFGGKSISEVMDANVRTYIQTILTEEFGKRNLTECQANRKEVFDIVRTKTVEYFENLGLKITSIGAAGQFTYSEPEIQSAINDKFSSEMKITSAKNEVEAAQKFAQAKNAIVDQKNLDADINIKNAIAEGIRTGTIPVPQTIAGNNISLMDLYGLKGLASKK